MNLPEDETITDYYQVLMVPENASPSTIKTAYRKLAMLVHPDRGGSHEKMTLLNEAFQIIGDPRLRERYDHRRRSAAAREETLSAKEDVATARAQAAIYPRTWFEFQKWMDEFVKDWSSEDNWTIHFNQIACPRCGHLTSKSGWRMPSSLREALWGGWTCRNCGQPFDKSGHPR